MRKWTTTQDFISNSKSSNPGGIIKFEGFLSVGDGGGAEWRFTGQTGQTPSQTPSDLADALLTDASGNQWEYIGKGIFPEVIGGKSDGVTDNTLITNALIAWNTRTGGNTYVGIGTYLTGRFRTDNANWSLTGLSKYGSIVKMIAGSDDNFIDNRNTTGIQIKNLTVDQNAANQSAGSAIIFSNVDNFEIDNVHIVSAVSDGILLQESGTESCKNGVVTNNDIRDCGSDAISLSGPAGMGTALGPKDISITDNYIFNSVTSGINVSQSEGVTVRGNKTIQDPTINNGHGGIRLSNGTRESTVVGNRIKGYSRGIFIAADALVGDDACIYNTVTGNTIKNTGNHGLLCEAPYNTITSNQFSDCQLISANDAVLRISNANGCAISNNVIRGAGLQPDGIRISGTSDACLYSANVIDGFSSLAIRDDSSGTNIGGVGN